MPHVNEKIDFTAEVFIVFKNTVLLRKHDKYKIWLSVGGHIELDEDPNEAAIREVKEEVGLDVILYDNRVFKSDSNEYKELIVPQFMNRHRISNSHEHITLTFFATTNTNELNVDLVKEVSDKLYWFTREELSLLAADIKPSVKYYALTALKTCGMD